MTIPVSFIACGRQIEGQRWHDGIDVIAPSAVMAALVRALRGETDLYKSYDTSRTIEKNKVVLHSLADFQYWPQELNLWVGPRFACPDLDVSTANLNVCGNVCTKLSSMRSR